MNLLHKKYASLLLILSSLLIIFHFSVLLVADPLQLFHKPWKRDSYFIRELRFQAAGIINNSEFDSIILGTSMAANFSPKEASTLFGGAFVNISPDGSLLSERSLILDYSLRQKRLKNVILSLDGFAEYGKYKEPFPISNFDYLYDKSKLNDLKVYSNRKYFRYIPCEYIDSYTKEKCKNLKTLENVAEWASSPYHNVRFGGLENWFNNYQKGQVIEALKRISSDLSAFRNGDVKQFDPQRLVKGNNNSRLVFDNYVLKYIKENPTINFYLYFPPYSTLKNSFIKKLDPTRYSIYREKIRYITNTLEKYENAYVFGFDQLEFTNVIANYKDLEHYHQKYNSQILKWMQAKMYHLNKDNLEAYLQEITNKADTYNVDTISEKVTCFLSGRNSAYYCANPNH